MAAGSPQTVDRIQVEIAFNSEGVNAELESINSSVDTTKSKLNSLERTSGNAAKSVKSIGTSVSASKVEFDRYNKTVMNAEKTFSVFNKYTSESAKSIDDVGKATRDAATGIDFFCDSFDETSDCVEWIPEAASQMNKLSDNTDNLANTAKKAKSMIAGLKGGLAGLGITAGITLLINKFNEMRDAAKEAGDEYDKIKTSLISYTGDLSDDLLKVVDSLYTNTVGNTGFMDREQVTKAVGATSTLWKEGTLDETRAIAKELATIQALGKISDTASYATTAKGAFVEWGVSASDVANKIEYLYYVSQQTGISMDALTAFMKDNGDALKNAGYTFESAAELVGNSFYSFADTTKLSDVMTSFGDKYDEKLQEYIDSWKAANGSMEVPEDVLNKFKNDAKNWAIAQVEGYKNTLAIGITEAQKDIKSSTEAWELTVKINPEVQDVIYKNTEQQKSVTSPVNAMQYDEAFQDERTSIRQLLQKYDQVGLFEMNVGKWASQLNSYLAGTQFEGQGKTLEEVKAEIIKEYGDQTEPTDYTDLLHDVNSSLDNITRYLSDIPTQQAESRIEKYETERIETIGQDISTVPVDELLSMLPESVATTLKSYQSVDKNTADSITIGLAQALSNHDIDLYYQIIDALTAAVSSANITVNPNLNNNVEVNTQQPQVTVEQQPLVDLSGILSILGVGTASAATEVVFNDEWNGLLKDTGTSIETTLTNLNDSLDTLNNHLADLPTSTAETLVEVSSPSVTVEPAPVTVSPPQVNVEQPQITVEPPQVNVAPAQVSVEPPQVVVEPVQVSVEPPQVTVEQPTESKSFWDSIGEFFASLSPIGVASASEQIVFPDYTSELADTNSAVNETLGRLNTSIENLNRYLSDTPVQKAEADINQYVENNLAYTNQEITELPTDELLKLLPASVAESLRSYQAIDKSAADQITAEIAEALNEHDIDLYYKLLDSITAGFTTAGVIPPTDLSDSIKFEWPDMTIKVPAPIVESEPVVVQTQPTVIESEPQVIQTQQTIIESEPAIVQAKQMVIETEPSIIQTKETIIETETETIRQPQVIQQESPAVPPAQVEYTVPEFPAIDVSPIKEGLLSFTEEVAKTLAESGLTLNVASFNGTLQMAGSSVPEQSAVQIISASEPESEPVPWTELKPISYTSLIQDIGTTVSGIRTDISARGTEPVQVTAQTIDYTDALHGLGTSLSAMALDLSGLSDRETQQIQIPDYTAELQDIELGISNVKSSIDALGTRSELDDLVNTMEAAMNSVQPAPANTAEPVVDVTIPAPIDYNAPLQDINTAVYGVRAGIDALNTTMSEQKNEIIVHQYFYAPTVDSYTVKNAATTALNTAQAGSYKMRA